eukprot:419964-Rhodomonas_salina.1
MLGKRHSRRHDGMVRGCAVADAQPLMMMVMMMTLGRSVVGLDDVGLICLGVCSCCPRTEAARGLTCPTSASTGRKSAPNASPNASRCAAALFSFPTSFPFFLSPVLGFGLFACNLPLSLAGWPAGRLA